ncbi:MAG TPA: SpvB/TcaC N-terminal domain-containing protein, partial [Chitinophagales bacterium]|nr:SpvB/TcaC N-terminal domain-containing protein [Chitinophagales bacterium]
DQPYTSLFTGAARYSIPIWTPQGRAGMQPSISLSYSSATVDGVLGDVQAPWTGVGWNIDGIEIVRKITTNENGYGYVNDFALTLNGAMYKLVQDNIHPSRYYTDHDAFLYIERHNYGYGNPVDADGKYPQNATGEWWEVVTTDGTRYRLGWNSDSEQLALMYGYKCTTGGSNCLTPDGAYSSLGYAGRANDLVALRWRVDRIQDTHGNFIAYSYYETGPVGGGIVPAFDRESYLDTIAYTGYENNEHQDKEKSPSYFVQFLYEARPGDLPSTFFLWDNLDSKLLDKINVCFTTTATACSSGNIVRTYDFGYSVASVPNADGTLTLTSMDVTGVNGTIITHAPTVRFVYENKANRAVNGSNNVYNYPRLAKIDNGAGGILTYTYEDDGRDANSWYNYRAKQVKVENGLGVAAMQSYAYTVPVYTGANGNANYGDLIGYTTTTENQLDYENANAVLLSTVHTFGTSGLDTGRELKTEVTKGATVYRRTTNVYVTDNSKAPFDKWNFRYLYSTLNYELSGGSMILTTKAISKRDPATGNLLSQIQYLGSTVYRKTYYEYLINTNPSVYILDTASRVLVVDASNAILSDTRYHYDDQINAIPIQGDLTLVQKLTGSGTQTVDQRTHYNEYGNADSSKIYSGYGNVDIDPIGTAFETTTLYDSDLETLPIRSTNPLSQETLTDYLPALGLPYRVTDPNGWQTLTAYDGLGRTLSVWAPGLSQPGVYYSYPDVNLSTGRIEAPYSV